MKAYRQFIIAALTLCLGGLFFGCAHTANGMKQDTHNAAEHVSDATK